MADAAALNSTGHGAAGARTDGSSSASHGANCSPREDQRTHGWVRAGTSRACMATGAQHTRPPASPQRTTSSRRSATLRSPSPRKDSAEFTLKPSPSSSNSKSEYCRSSSITFRCCFPGLTDLAVGFTVGSPPDRPAANTASPCRLQQPGNVDVNAGFTNPVTVAGKRGGGCSLSLSLALALFPAECSLLSSSTASSSGSRISLDLSLSTLES